MTFNMLARSEPIQRKGDREGPKTLPGGLKSVENIQGEDAGQRQSWGYLRSWCSGSGLFLFSLGLQSWGLISS